MNTKSVLLISPAPSSLEPMLLPFRNAGFTVRAKTSLELALPLIDPAAPPSLIVLDARSDASGKALRQDAMTILSRCALTYIAAVSPMDAQTFHDAMEGLGLLPPLPVHPTEKDGGTLLRSLQRFLPEK